MRSNGSLTSLCPGAAQPHSAFSLVHPGDVDAAAPRELLLPVPRASDAARDSHSQVPDSSRLLALFSCIE